MGSLEDELPACLLCGQSLLTPYIQCATCPPPNRICLHCFARGRESAHHHSDHPYSVVKLDFPVYEKHWSATDELELLDAVENFGYGNWRDVSTRMKKKSAAECERHYNHCYVSNPQAPLPSFPEYKPEVFPAPVVFKLSEDPPRPQEGSTLCQEMGGYCAARGEFTVEFNNFAEMDVCHLTCETAREGDESEEEEMNDIKLALLHSYRQKLRERHRRKRIVKEYGLINTNKLSRSYIYGHDREVRQQVSDLRVFTSLVTPLDNDKLLEAIIYEHELKTKIRQLQECRSNGLQHLHAIRLYKILRSRRGSCRQKRHLLSDVINHIRDDAACQMWLQRHITTPDGSVKIIPLPSAPRKSAPPLEIHGLPGYDKLSGPEKEFCQSVRLVPEAFLEFCSLLVAECRRHGGLRLGQARPLIKIDVNKTRKIYDFLLEQGRITKPS